MKIKKIRYLKLSLTNKCNSKCLTCWHSNKTPFDLFDMDDKVYQQIKEKIFPNLKILDLLSGGEIFMYSRVNELLEDIKKYQFKTVIESNLSIITNKQKEILKDMNVDIIASLDGSTKELQEALRPGCHYESVLKNIRFFVKHGKRVHIRMTVSSYNFYDMENLLHLAEELGVEGVILHGAQFLDSLDLPLKFSKAPEDMEYVNSLIKKKFTVEYDLFLDFFRSSAMVRSPQRCFYCVMDPIVAAGAGLWTRFKNIWAWVFKTECCPITPRFIKVDITGEITFCSSFQCHVLGDLNKNTLEEIIDTKEWDMHRRNCSCSISKRFKSK